MRDIADLVGRIFISLIFFFEVYDTIGFWQSTKDTMTAYNITWHQDLLLVTMLVFLILGSLMVLIGYYANIGAFFLLLYLVPFTLIVFSFWNDPIAYRRVNSLQFMRNMAICGGLLLMIANGGAGKYSIKRMLHVLRVPAS